MYTLNKLSAIFSIIIKSDAWKALASNKTELEKYNTQLSEIIKLLPKNCN